MKAVIWYRIYLIAIGTALSSALFFGGYKLLVLGIEAEGRFAFKSSLLSGSISAESAGLALIFAGIVVFLTPFILRTKITRDRMIFRLCQIGQKFLSKYALSQA